MWDGIPDHEAAYQVVALSGLFAGLAIGHFCTAAGMAVLDLLDALTKAVQRASDR